MVVKQNSKRQGICFSMLSAGDPFTWDDGTLWMKIMEIYDDESCCRNAVCLTNGAVSCFDSANVVYLVSAEIVIK